MSEAKNMVSALSEAQAIVEGAKRRAAELLAEAEENIKSIKKNAYQDAFDKGIQDAALNAVRLLEFTNEVEESLSERAARLALQISATLIGEHLKVEPESVKRLAKRALRESHGGSEATIIVNPEDKNALQSILPELSRMIGGNEVKIEDDPLLVRGGCIVRTEYGEVDASIEALLQAIAHRLGLKK